MYPETFSEPLIVVIPTCKLNDSYHLEHSRSGLPIILCCMLGCYKNLLPPVLFNNIVGLFMVGIATITLHYLYH